MTLPKLMGRTVGVLFPVHGTLFASFASHGPDHLCIVFYHRTGEEFRRVSSYAAEGLYRNDYFSESEGRITIYGLTLTEAIERAERESC